MTKSRRRKSNIKSAESSRVPSVLIAGAVAIVACLLAVWYQASLQDDRPREAPVPAAADEVIMPGEFDPQEFLLLGGTQLVELYPSVLLDVIRAAHDEVRIMVLVGSEAEAQKISESLAEQGISRDAVEFLRLPIRTMWVRDFGPLTVVDGAGERRLIDFHYRERRGNTLDDGVSAHVADHFGWPRLRDELLLEGGDFLSNGRGLCLASTRIMARNEYYQQFEPGQVAERLAARLGFETLVLLEPLQGESTGHLDMFCTLLAPDLCVLGRYDPAVDALNADLLDQAAARLAQEATLAGPLRVERVPMPPHDDDVWRSYTNVIFAGETLLVPVYPDCCPELDAAALDVYRRLLPDRRVVGIDASQLVEMRGVLRCLTMNVPQRGIPVH